MTMNELHYMRATINQITYDYKRRGFTMGAAIGDIVNVIESELFWDGKSDKPMNDVNAMHRLIANTVSKLWATTYTVYTDGKVKRNTYDSENSARHNAIKWLGNVFVSEAMVVDDSTGEIVFEVKRVVTINSKP